MIKKTPFYDKHIELGANMVDFFGFSLPIYYQGINVEHNHVRNSVGIFDVSHMGQLILEGNEVFEFLQKVTTNNIAKIQDGRVQYTCMTNENGMVLDDLLIYKLSTKKYMLVVNASNTSKIINWLSIKNTFSVKITDITLERGLLAVQGPKAINLVQKLTNFNLSKMKSYSFEILKIKGLDDILISSTGYTGSGGFEIYGNKNNMRKIWNILFSFSDFNTLPIGLGARDTLRLEMGYCLYGNELSENISPLEAKLFKIIDFSKNFIGSDVLRKKKIKKELIAFELEEKGIPRNGYDILNENDKKIGFVSSGTMSPSLNKAIGMGFLDNGEKYKNIFILVRNKKLLAKIVQLPFYKND